MGGSPVVVEGWVEFDALVEVLPWGRSDYVIIRPAPALAEGAKAAGTRRVDGTIDDVPVNVGVNRADVLPDAFMYAGKGLQRRLGVRPGAVVSCRLRPADTDKASIARIRTNSYFSQVVPRREEFLARLAGHERS